MNDGLRKSNLDMFRNYTQKILPKMEERIELSMLQKQFQSISNESIKKELIQSYIKRRINLDENIMAQPETNLKQDPFKEIEKHNVYVPVQFKDVTEDDIGFYLDFDPNDFEKYFFAQKMFGNYQDELSITKKFSLMLTEESLKIIDLLTKIQNTHGKPFDFTQYNYEDENSYFHAMRVLTLEFVDAVKKYRSDLMFERLFKNSQMQDMLIEVILFEMKDSQTLINEMKNNVTRQQFFVNLIEEIKLQGDPKNANPYLLNHNTKIFNNLEVKLSNQDIFKFNLHSKYYKEYFKKNKDLKPESLTHYFNNFKGINSGIMLTGERGSGKSGVLNVLTMWAIKNKWFVIPVINGRDWTQIEQQYMLHPTTGLQIQVHTAGQWLEYFKQINQDIIESFEIDYKIYGKYNFSGVHQNDPEAVPNIYYKERGVYFKEYEQFQYPEEKALIKEQDQKMSVNLQQKLPKPKNLLEIVNYGIEDIFYANNVIYEVLEQLRNTEKHCVLELVDGFNYFYQPSIFLSYKYKTDRKLDGRIPPYHLSLCRAFMHLDGHKIKNGFKVVASNLKHQVRHKFNSEKIFLPQGYEHQMDGVPLDDFRNMCVYYSENKLFLTDPITERQYEYFWMQTQGNWHWAQQWMKNHYADLMYENLAKND